jgi:UDP-N-acetylglucosamine--N-acetylmuramyl-(pentapeptide) pyrophosphoryl-undecaprenol N-acetylglucosamine transferase
MSNVLRTSLSELRGESVIVVASTGGHLEQAVRWASRLGISPDSTFVTFDSPQSRSILADWPHIYVPYIAPRDIRAMLAAIPCFWKVLRGNPNVQVLSTGAGIALPAYLIAVMLGRRLHYIESVSRFTGPSLTGRLLSRVPKVTPYAQHEGYPGRRWHKVESLLSDYVVERVTNQPSQPRKYFVTLGTIRPYRFDALVDAVLSGLNDDDEVVWQLGETTRLDLPGAIHSAVPPSEFDRHAREADVVITHAGVGSVLRLLELGISPIVVPRSRQRQEHVDDHQGQVASALSRTGLITSRQPGEINHWVLHQGRPAITKVY